MQDEENKLIDIRSLSLDELKTEMSEMGQPSFRAKQIFQWLSRDIGSFDEMTNISKDLRQQLAQRYSVYRPVVLSKQVSSEDGTIKYLWQYHLYLHPGRLPAGLCVLCLHHWRSCSKLNSFRNAERDHFFAGGFRKEDQQYSVDGHRGAAG